MPEGKTESKMESKTLLWIKGFLINLCPCMDGLQIFFAGTVPPYFIKMLHQGGFLWLPVPPVS